MKTWYRYFYSYFTDSKTKSERSKAAVQNQDCDSKASHFLCTSLLSGVERRRRDAHVKRRKKKPVKDVGICVGQILPHNNTKLSWLSTISTNWAYASADSLDFQKLILSGFGSVALLLPGDLWGSRGSRGSTSFSPLPGPVLPALI